MSFSEGDTQVPVAPAGARNEDLASPVLPDLTVTVHLVDAALGVLQATLSTRTMKASTTLRLCVRIRQHVWS